MKRAFLLSVGIFVLAASAHSIDLTPRFITTYTDGLPTLRPFFRDGDKKFGVTLDTETKLMPYEDSALFYFEKFQRASMRLLPSPMKAEVSFEAANLPRYREASARLLPKEAEKPVMEKELADVIPINGWLSYSYTYTYEIVGTRFRESITFINFDAKQQVALQIKATESEFPVVSVRGWDIIARWHEIKPDAEKEGN